MLAMLNLKWLVTRTVVLVLMMLPAVAMAQAVRQTASPDAYPSKPIVVIIPVAAGPTDAEFRIFLPKLAEIFSQPFILENKPGAGQSIGTAVAARAAPIASTAARGKP